MTAPIKTATAYTRKFKMVKSSDHVSGATQAFIGAAPSVRLHKGSGASTAAAAAGTVTELDSTNIPGWFQIAFTTGDTGVSGDMAVSATGTGCDATDWVEMVQAQVFTDLGLDASGNVKIASQVKQNTAFLLPFIMTVNGIPTAGLSGFVAQRNIAGAGFGLCANAVVEDGSGWYHILLAGTDTNGTVIEVHITANTADDRNITIYTQP